MVVQVHDSVFATPFLVLSTHPYQIHCMYFLQVRPHPRLQVKGTLICPPFNPRHSPNNPSHNKLIFGIHQSMYSSTVHLIQLLIVIVHLGVLSLLTDSFHYMYTPLVESVVILWCNTQCSFHIKVQSEVLVSR